MPIEYEARFSSVDTATFLSQLSARGGRLVHPEVLLRRQVYFIPGRERTWLRVRDEGTGEIHVTLKSQEHTQGVSSVREQEVVLGATTFEDACAFFDQLGLDAKAYQENMRETWEYHGCQVMIDTWPGLQPCIEIEGPGAEQVGRIAEEFGFAMEQATFGNIGAVYQQELGMSLEDFDRMQRLTFTDFPHATRDACSR